MARMTRSAKAQRVVTFMLGLRIPEAGKALVARGFGEEELAEGGRRLMALMRIRVHHERRGV